MTDEQNPAPSEAGVEVVQPEAVEVEAAEAPESTEGQVETPPAEAEEAEEKQKSESAKRRERRKAVNDDLRASEARARQERDEAEARLKAAREAAQSIPKPKESDYQTLDDYQAALSAFQVAQIIDGREVQRLEQEAKSHFEQIEVVQRQKAQEDAQHWATQVQEGRQKYSDFDAVAGGEHVRITTDMSREIVQSDHAADIAYFLGKNPDIAAGIAEISDPVSLARAVTRLEARVTAPKPKTVTDAPEPIAAVKGKAAPTKSPGDMSPAEYREWIDKGGTF